MGIRKTQRLLHGDARRLYGYDRSATLGDAATLNDATRNDATHNALPTLPTTRRPNAQRERRQESLALAVCFIPKSQTCNSYETNPFR